MQKSEEKSREYTLEAYCEIFEFQSINKMNISVGIANRVCHCNAPCVRLQPKYK